MRIPTEQGLEARNVATVMKKNTVNVEMVPIRPRKKAKPVFNAWVNDIEYKKHPFFRVAFDGAVEEIVEMFYQELGTM
jgi:hypothetical protein